MIRIEHNVETGEVIEIALTAQEIKELEIAEKARIAKIEAQELQATTQAAEKAALLAKLGITADEAKLLLS